MFADRKDAGKRLAARVSYYLQQSLSLQKSDVVVVGLPRGGVPVALEVARLLHCPLTISVSKKIPFPDQPELAMGAVSSRGIAVFDQSLKPHLSNWQSYIEEQKQRLLCETKTKEAHLLALAGCPRLNLAGKTVILVDDGIATGMTALAALRSLREEGANKVILAVPVISYHSARQLLTECDALIALVVPEDFRAVGQYYVDFRQTTDEDVAASLTEGEILLRRTA